MSNAPKTVLCIHDLPGFGRAGLSVIVPVLSALGAQAVAVPTAVLSTHTGGLGTPAKLANPGYGPAALEHYRRLGLRFDCIYSGYLADASQAKLVEQAIDLWPDALTVVDPVMGDHGRMYRGLAPEMVPAMYTLCSRASLILPNTTEAALLLGDPMPGVTGEAELHTAQTQAQRLTRICPRVLITGVAAGRGIACVGADRATGESLVRTPMVPKSFHGTGDIFGAVLARIQTLSLQQDMDRMLVDPFYFVDSNNSIYILFMVVGIIGFFTIPSVAGWVVQASGFGAYNRKLNAAGMKAKNLVTGTAGYAWGKTAHLWKSMTAKPPSAASRKS